MTADRALIGKPTTPDRLLVAGVALAVRLAYLGIKPANVYSDDVRGWKTVAATFAAGHNPYSTGLLNWPPVWPCVIWGMDHVSRWTSVGFVPLLWTLLIAIELVLIDATLKLQNRFDKSATARKVALIGLALNPVAILQTTQHGNFDVLVSLLMLLGLTSLIRFHLEVEHSRRHWLTAAAWIGAAAATKTVPLVLTPLLFAGTRRLDWKSIAKGCVLLVLPLFTGMSIIYAIDPTDVRVFVLNYRSFGEFYGFSGLANLFGWDALTLWLARGFIMLAPVVAVLLCVKFYLRARPLEPQVIILIAAALLLGIPTLGPGYSNQYIYWYLPLLVISWCAWPAASWRRLLMLGWIIAGATYCFEYAIQPPLGNLLLRWFPKSDWPLGLTIAWSDRRGQIVDRLPLFAVDLAVWIEAVRMLWQQWRWSETEKPRRSEALSVQDVIR